MGILHCCSFRREADFELVYHLGSEERRKKFSIACPDGIKKESILINILEKINAMPVPDYVKMDVRNNNYLLNGSPVESVNLSPRNLKKSSAINRVHVVQRGH